MDVYCLHAPVREYAGGWVRVGVDMGVVMVLAEVSKYVCWRQVMGKREGGRKGGGVGGGLKGRRRSEIPFPFP